MAAFVTDSFTDTANTAITSHTGEVGATWTKHPTLATNAAAPKIGSNDLVAGETSGTNAIYYASGSPASADYPVQVDITLAASSSVADGPALRIDTGAGTGYFGLLFTAGTSVAVYKYVTGTLTAVSSLSVSLTTGVTYRTTITSSGTTLTLRIQRLSDNQYLNSSAAWQSGATDCISTTDASISAAGKAGFWLAQSATASTWDNFSAGASADTTPPVLTTPTGSATGPTTATVGATTDEGNGTLYAVVTTSATQPSVAQIKAGQTHTGSAAPWGGSVAVSSTGAKTLSSTGLTASTAYYGHLVHSDAAGNDSNRVSSATFSTPAVPGLTSNPLKNNTGTLLTNQPFEAYVSNPSTGALVLKKTGLTSHATTAVVTFTDASLTAATAYRVVWRQTSTGAEGLETLTAT